VTLLLAVPQGNGLRRIVIPPERRSFFGTRIERQLEERAMCVSSYAASARSDPLTVLGPDELTVTGAAESSAVLPDDVFRTCDADVRPPIAIHTEHAQFTPDAMRAKVTGSVLLQGVVAADGSVRNVRVVQPLEPSLDAAARGAFLRWRFRPAMRAEQPVAMAVTVQMAFTMR